MITDAILGIFLFLLNIVLSVLPTATMPAGISNAMNWLFTSVSPFSFIIPFQTLFSLIGLVLIAEGFIFAFKTSNFIFNKLRGSGT